MTDLAYLDATAQAELVRNGDASPLELVDAAITRVEKLNPELNAVIHPLFEHARTAARGTLPDGPFRGVPTVLKDLDGAMAGQPFHMGNKLLKEIGYHAEFDSYLYEKLRAAGFVVVGKTNTPEFGLLPTAEPLAYGATHNPWDTTRSTGGSSGGSAAAVASGMVPVAHAGDGGGSIRIPASACGIFGLKPSRGRISLGPEISESWGGFTVRFAVTRSVRDCAAMLDVLAGPMPGDYYTAPFPTRPYRDELGADPGKLRVGLCLKPPANIAVVDEECIAAAQDAARLFESLGHTVEQAAPEAFARDDFLAVFTNIYTANTAHDLDDLAVRAGRPVGPDDVEPITWAMAEAGRAVTASQYIESLNVAHQAVRHITPWWEVDGFDLLLSPTMAEPPAKLGDVGGGPDPITGFARATPFAAFTAVFNVTGQPSASVPLYFSASGLPIGVQITAAPWRDDVLVRVAAQLEEARPWADRRPPIHA